MPRALVVFGLALLSGCSVQNPYALFGPAKVPAPASAEVAPYYPAGIAASAPAKQASASGRPSISVSTPAAPVSATAAIGTEDPIHIAENPSAGRKQADSTPPANPPPNPRSPPLPAKQTPPATSHLRRDSFVAPANHAVPVPALTESPKAAGQWRAR